MSSPRLPGAARSASLSLLAATIVTASLPVAAQAPAAGHSPVAHAEVLASVHTGNARPTAAHRVMELDWKQLLPASERRDYDPQPPPPIHDYRGEAGPPAVQKPDFKANRSLDGALVRLPGFIVPLEARQDGVVSEFLLVPYFGSCIHVPPPPPNQLVYVRMAHRTTLQSIYDAYWITGKLHLQTRKTHLGAAAYELSADRVERYEY